MSTFNLFSTLERSGKSLTKLLGEAKSKHKTTETPIHNRVEWTLEELTKHDTQNASGYGDLATTLGNFVSDFSRTLATSVSTHKTKNNNNSNNNNNVQEANIINLENSMSSLNDFEETLLFELFIALPKGTEVKKNDLFLCWFSMTEIYVDDEKRNLKLEFEDHLKKLVEMKLIEQVAAGVGSLRINTKRENVEYIMPNTIWSEFQQSNNNETNDKLRITPCGIVANTSACNLTTKRLNWLSTVVGYPDIKMLQLGSWNNDPTKYIVAEDMEALTKVFNRRSFVSILSLQGVSGIVELPSLATMAEYLKVLNLKGCHNLESLPSQFNTLRSWELGYLDLSECYLLDHLPNAFSGCTKLRVLKGFVLPREPQHPFISNPFQFEHLWKLTLRTKRLNFPTNSDLEALCELKSLTHLKITWVGACSDTDNGEVQFDNNSKFPPKLTKFEMEAASDNTSTKILDLIARQKESIPIPLEKLYIKGGNLSKIDQNVDCKILRLQYLPKMQHSCYDMMRTFPKLHRLEMSKDVMYSMLRQSFQKATGTNDDNSGWEPSFTRHAALSPTS